SLAGESVAQFGQPQGNKNLARTPRTDETASECNPTPGAGVALVRRCPVSLGAGGYTLRRVPNPGGSLPNLIEGKAPSGASGSSPRSSMPHPSPAIPSVSS